MQHPPALPIPPAPILLTARLFAQAIQAIARQQYAAAGPVHLIQGPLAERLAQTTAALAQRQPILGATLLHDGVLFNLDILLPEGEHSWRLLACKASTGIKPQQQAQLALQTHLARQAGVPLLGAGILHVNSRWLYCTPEDFQGLLQREDLSRQVWGQEASVRQLLATAQATLATEQAPPIATGPQCQTPAPCDFLPHCQSEQPQAEFPARWLPAISHKELRQFLAARPGCDMREVPDTLLTPLQQRVKQHTLAGQVYFDAAGAAAALQPDGLPALFLDFESIQFAVPPWLGTRPYQQIVFQFSLHRLDADGQLSAQGFLDVSGGDPRAAFAEALLAACDGSGPIFVYNAGFEGARIGELAQAFPALSPRLLTLRARLVDLHPITRDHYYHPAQHGRWSIKAVLPVIAPDLSYQQLDGVQDGGMAMESYLEAIQPDTPAVRKAEIEQQLRDYCALDTLALVRLWRHLSGQSDTHLAPTT